MRTWLLRSGAVFTGLLAMAACSEPVQDAPAGQYAPAGEIKPGDAMLYRLVPESAQVRVTVLKDAAVPVTGTFESLSGLISSQGGRWSGFVGSSTAHFRTGHAARDSNIQTSFFQNPISGDVSAAAKISVHWQDVVFTLAASEGVAQAVTVPATVELGAVRLPLQVQATVTRAGSDLVVESQRAALSIRELGYGTALEALMRVCGHKSVEDSIALEFRGTFRAATLAPAPTPVSSPHP